MDQMPKKPKPAPLKDDLKYIKCATCQKMAGEAYRKVVEFYEEQPPDTPARRRFEASGAATLSERVELLLEEICNPENDGKKGASASGKWLRNYDIRKKSQGGAATELELVNAGKGICRRECYTIAKSCESLLSKLSDGEDDLSEVLIKMVKERQSAGMVQQRICTKLAGVCKKGKVPLWPEGKARKDEEFKPRDEKQDSIDDLLASLNKDAPEGQALTSMSAGDLDLGGDDEEEEALKEEL